MLCIEMCRMPVQFDHVKKTPGIYKHYIVCRVQVAFDLFDMVVSRTRLLRKGLINMDVLKIASMSDIT